MKILIAKSIFCPNTENLNITLSSLVKIDTYFKMLNIHYDLLLIGWINTFEKDITGLLKLHPFYYTNITKIYWNINYGKYKIINTIKQFLNNKDYDLLLYFDHDVHIRILCDEAISHITTLLSLKINDKIPGLLVFNQKKDVRHQPDIYENQLILQNIQVCYPSNIASIATGGFAINVKIYCQMPDLELISVYGLDDYYLLKSINDMGFINIILMNDYIIHPFRDNKHYSQWKYNIISDLITNKYNSNYFQSIENSINFWNNN